MITDANFPSLIRGSVIAVPPLARDNDGRLNPIANQRIMRHLENGGVTSLLYGGNANLYHVRPSEYAELLRLLVDTAGADSWVIPSVGPAYGVMMDQAEVLSDFAFPTVMVLPQREIADSSGIATGIARFVQRLGRPIVLYIKHDGLIDIADAQRLERDGSIALAKYAVVRDNPERDDYLRRLLDVVPAERVVSGMGEQPAIVHMRQFGLGGFTSGCVCVAPRLSQAMLRAIIADDDELAERIRRTFAGLETVRNEISPIRVLHRAVSVSGVADTGPIEPLLSDIDAATDARIRAECAALMRAERGA